jgi:hypothetical protein
MALQAGWTVLMPAATPADNPLRGLVPYQGQGGGRFPHSMEFNYLPLDAVMKGEDKFEWDSLESLLEDIRSRGNQTVVRFYLEYPGRPSGVPGYLRDQGLKLHKYLNTNTQPLPPKEVETPDYTDPRLERALVKFIAAFGRKYDGDPRLGYVTAGLLGTWGEWHTYPRNDLHPPKRLQTAVMDAYEKAFQRTPVLLRYPAEEDDAMYASNRRRRMGYHDDSFAWATLDTGKPSDSWFFVPRLKAAKVQDRWKVAPIGGEIRPEAWGRVFDPDPLIPEIQDFDRCVAKTHATWLMDSGMFQSPPSRERTERALASVAKMGYAFTVTRARRIPGGVEFEVENRGVAPLYAGWMGEAGSLEGGRLTRVVSIRFDFRQLLPGDRARVTVRGTFPGSVLLRIPNPMRGGKPVRFGNATQDADRPGWLTLL